MSFLVNGLQFIHHTIFTPVKYHGLLNQGATCYLNSVLQVLFMTEDFRAAVERHNCENPDTEHIDRHLKTLFDDLKEDTANTLKITRKLGIERVTEQRDAAEYLEKILSLTSPEASQIFHGLLTHKTKCSACSTETDIDGAFWLLPLALVDSCREHYSVVDGIKEYFRATHFSGENQMYCDQCDAKADATIKCVIKHHPEVLMLLLKRFQFDYYFMEYVKLNRTVDVPCTLQIPENQTYELYAVVEHFGDLRSGHYTATIKDDEKWYNFNDDWVKLADHQPLQGDNFDKGSSAYLLFYRKTTVDAADICTQDIKEASTPEDVPLATSDINDINAVKIREREEAEAAAGESNDTAVDVSINRNEETEIKDSIESRGVGLSPDRCYNVENQDINVNTRQSAPHKYDEERNDAHAETQRDEGKMITDDKEDMGGNAWADDRAEKRDILCRETQLEESVEVQDNDSGRQRSPDISSDFEAEVSDRHEIHGHLNKEDEMSDAQRRVDDVKTDMDGKTGDDEQLEKTKYPDREAEHQDNEYNARQNISEDLGGAHDVDLKPGSVDEQGDETRMDVDVMVDEEGKTGADERGLALKQGKLLTKYDPCSYEIQYSRRVGDQRCKDESSSRCERHEQQREQRRDVQGVKEQKRGDDKHAQRRETLETQDDFGQDVEDQNNDGNNDIRQNTSEQKISVTYTRHKDDGEERRAEEQENERDERIQNRAVSSFRREGAAASTGLTENWGVGSVEQTRQEDAQPKARFGFNEGSMEGRGGSKKSRVYQGKIIEEEIRETPSGIQRSSETKNIRIETVVETSQQEVLSKGVADLKLSGSSLRESKKHGTKRVIENTQQEKETDSASHSKKKKLKFSDAREQAAEMKDGARENKKKIFCLFKKQGRKKTPKKKKTRGCFSFFKSQKKVDQTSESE